MKEPTDTLIKLSLYYKLNLRFCNAYSGSEKCHVKKNVERVKRKTFSKNTSFNSLDDVNKLLINTLVEINDKVPYSKNKTAKNLLEEEKVNLLPDMPIYETATLTEVRISVYVNIKMLKNSNMEMHKNYKVNFTFYPDESYHKHL